MSKSENEGVTLPIEWMFPSHINGQYASQLIVQHQESEFILSFFEIYPPIVLGTAEEKAVQLKEMKSVTAKCVARVIVTPSRMEEFVQLMTKNLQMFRQRRPRAHGKGKTDDSAGH